MSKRHMDTAPLLVAENTAPTRYEDVQADDIITFGSRKTEWVITEKHGLWLHVRCIKHPDSTQVGRTTQVRQGLTAIWLLS
jgi:hypothetical protein